MRRGEELPTPVIDRAAGALLGLAVGDALGAGYEFEAAPSGDVGMIGGGIADWAPGEWTDDTQMAICVAEVAATGALDAIAVAQRFLDWFAYDPRDVGIQTRDVLGSATSSGRRGGAVPRSASRRLPDSSAGNGSLMRTAPVALAHLGDDDAILGAADGDLGAHARRSGRGRGVRDLVHRRSIVRSARLASTACGTASSCCPTARSGAGPTGCTRPRRSRRPRSARTGTS